MIDGMPVIDATVHGYNYARDNLLMAGPGADGFEQIIYDITHKSIAPRGDPRWLLERNAFMAECPPDLLAWCLFGESQTDLACHHAPGMFGFFRDGGSPTSIARAAEAIAPGRFLYYGAMRTVDVAEACDMIDRQIEEHAIIGVKFYPTDLWEGHFHRTRLDDEARVFPMIEHARRRGVHHIAIHKAVAFAPVPLDDYRVADVEKAAAAFPDMTFEIVHAGWSFVEDTAFLLQCYPNVYANLESTSAFLNVAPRRFAELLAAFLGAGAEDRIVWATGAMGVHPRPLVEAFAAMEMPADLVEGFGAPPLTRDIKTKILGGNFARKHGLDLDALVAALPDDEFRKRQRDGLAEPWSRAPSRHVA